MRQMNFWAFALAVVLLAGCHYHSKTIHCKVSPDEVFGRHYSAADFGIWHVDDFNGRYFAIVDSVLKTLPDSVEYECNATNGLVVDTTDTAAVSRALGKGMIFMAETGVQLRPYWRSLNGNDMFFQLIFIYGKRMGCTDDSAPIDASHISNASYSFNSSGQVEVNLAFDGEGTELFRQFTAESIGHPGAIVLGDRLLSTPMVRAEISGGRCSVSGLSVEEACALAQILKNRQP